MRRSRDESRERPKAAIHQYGVGAELAASSAVYTISIVLHNRSMRCQHLQRGGSRFVTMLDSASRGMDEYEGLVLTSTQESQHLGTVGCL